ncbi:MAG: hypothetical protein WC592_02610 [Candidatus Omnitrophota bacterium]
MSEQNPATIIKNAVEDLAGKIIFLSGEVATFKQALCDLVIKANDSSNKMLKASKMYFAGSIILSAVIAFSALVPKWGFVSTQGGYTLKYNQVTGKAVVYKCNYSTEGKYVYQEFPVEKYKP